MAAIFFTSCISCISCLAITDCVQKKRNNRMDLKMHREMREFQYVLMKKTRGIKCELTKSLIINSEIDNYSFKTKYHQVLFSNNNLYVYEYGMKKQVAGGENDHLVAKFKARDNLKRRMMPYIYYNNFGNSKTESVMESFNTGGPYAKEAIYNQYKEWIVYYNREKNMRLLGARNRALRNHSGGMYSAVIISPSV